jgi:hypothetical protein
MNQPYRQGYLNVFKAANLTTSKTAQESQSTTDTAQDLSGVEPDERLQAAVKTYMGDDEQAAKDTAAYLQKHVDQVGEDPEHMDKIEDLSIEMYQAGHNRSVEVMHDLLDEKHPEVMNERYN